MLIHFRLVKKHCHMHIPKRHLKKHFHLTIARTLLTSGQDINFVATIIGMDVKDIEALQTEGLLK